LTFTPANFSTEQFVNVCGVDDSTDDGDQPFLVVAQSASSEPEFDGSTQAVGYLNLNDDFAGFSIVGDPTQVTELAGPNHTDTFSVALTAQPSVDVNIQVTSGSSADYSVAPAVLTFTPANFATPQNVTVTGIDDAACEFPDPEVADTALLALSGSGEYSGLNTTVQNQTSDPEDVCGNPNITQAVINTGANTINVTYNEAVTCNGGVVATADNFTYTNTAGGSPGPNRTGTNITQNGANGCVVTFDGPVFITEDAGTINYLGDGTDVEDVDPSPLPAADGSTQASIAGGPVASTPTVSAGADSVFVGFNQPVECSSEDSTVPITDDFTVTVNGQATAILSIGGCGGARDNDVQLVLNRDILVGDVVNVSIAAGSLSDNRGDTNSAQNFTGIIAA